LRSARLDRQAAYLSLARIIVGKNVRRLLEKGMTQEELAFDLPFVSMLADARHRFLQPGPEWDQLSFSI
jgi:hypothetical protein